MTRDQCLEQIGGLVAYTPPAPGNVRHRTAYGYIARVTDTYVFVQFKGDVHAKATAPHLLTLLKEAQPT